MITIVGLGPGKIDQLTLEAWHILENAEEVYLRTARHPLRNQLPSAPTYHSFDELYDTAESFESLYAEITARMLELGRRPEGVIYAVPGHPLIAETTAHLILQQAQTANIPVKIVEGLSFIEPMLTALGVEGVDGLQLHDAITIGQMYHPPLNPDQPALLAQVYSREVASDLKLTLMNQYPDNYPVRLVHGAGTAESLVEDLALFEIDRSEHIAHLTSLYIPAMPEKSSFAALLDVMAELRAPNGCPWDQKQTHASLRPYLLEETYEVLEAIDTEDMGLLTEELGDLLTQVVFHSQIAIDEGEFYLADVLHHIIAKLIRRHPHVWGTKEIDTAEGVVVSWEAIKREEQAAKGEAGLKARESVLDGVPMGLPALVRAARLQEKAGSVGFDWDEIAPVIAKVHEEIAEISEADSLEYQKHEFGDLLFAIVNWTRWLKLDAESLLREANIRFYKRFNYIEQQIAKGEREWADFTLDELDAYWDEAKRQGL